MIFAARIIFTYRIILKLCLPFGLYFTIPMMSSTPRYTPAEQAEDLEQQVMQLMERASRGWGKPLRIDRSKLATTTE